MAFTRSLGVNVGVVISDTFGRPWRVGVTDAAVGFAGFRRSKTCVAPSIRTATNCR